MPVTTQTLQIECDICDLEIVVSIVYWARYSLFGPSGQELEEKGWMTDGMVYYCPDCMDRMLGG